MRCWQAETGAGLFGTALVDSQILDTKPTCLGPRTGASQAVRNEEIKLIERVLLFPGQQVRQVVVLCGIDGQARGGYSSSGPSGEL